MTSQISKLKAQLAQQRAVPLSLPPGLEVKKNVRINSRDDTHEAKQQGNGGAVDAK